MCCDLDILRSHWGGDINTTAHHTQCVARGRCAHNVTPLVQVICAPIPLCVAHSRCTHCDPTGSRSATRRRTPSPWTLRRSTRCPTSSATVGACRYVRGTASSTRGSTACSSPTLSVRVGVLCERAPCGGSRARCRGFVWYGIMCGASVCYGTAVGYRGRSVSASCPALCVWCFV